MLLERQKANARRVPRQLGVRSILLGESRSLARSKWGLAVRSIGYVDGS